VSSTELLQKKKFTFEDDDFKDTAENEWARKVNSPENFALPLLSV